MTSHDAHIFLAGGGDAEDSKEIDTRFVAMLDHTKPLVYIPNAMRSRPYAACREWFHSVMEPLGVSNIEMWEDLHPHRSANEIAGLYIGGGDTAKLLTEIRESGFDEYLYELNRLGIPLYGGSAGAIILGADIRTEPEAQDLDVEVATGLSIIEHYAIACHYRAAYEHSIRTLSQSIGYTIIAIPEKAGADVSNGVLTNYGTESIAIIGTDTTVHVASERTFAL